jgi:TetR/AcrR family transcriptional regulator
VGIQEIVEAAGVTKPTLYHYFGSKYGLLETLLAENFARLNRAVEQAADYRRDLPLTLTRLVKTYFDFAGENPEFYRLQLSMWFAAPASEPFKAVSKLNEKHYTLLVELFLKATEDHGNMAGRHRAYAVTFLGMVNNYISLWLNRLAELDEALVYQAVHQFMYGIFS